MKRLLANVVYYAVMCVFWLVLTGYTAAVATMAYRDEVFRWDFALAVCVCVLASAAYLWLRCLIYWADEHRKDPQ